MKWYFGVWKKYATFRGRARRKEYWTFSLLSILFGFVIMLAVGVIGTFILAAIPDPEPVQAGALLGALANAAYTLAVFIPTVAVTVRRLHDTGRSGWWLFIPVVNFILLFGDSQPSTNEYGPNPKVTDPRRGIAQAA